MDLCLENTSGPGSPPDTLTSRQLAEKVTEIYWPHTLPFGSPRTSTVLKQATGGQAEILSYIDQFRSLLQDGSVPLIKARVSNTAAYLKLLNQIEWKLIEVPLPRLQTIGISVDSFIYQINWDQNIPFRDVIRYQRGVGEFDNRILLKPRVGEFFVRLNGLLRPLIQRRWA